MPIRITCPKCRVALEVMDAAVPRQVRCAKCHTLLALGPSPITATPATPPRLEHPPASVDAPSAEPPDGPAGSIGPRPRAIPPPLPASAMRGVGELRCLTGHEFGGILSRGVASVAFAPDGRQVLSGGADKTIRLWDPASGQQLRCLTGHAGSVSAVAFIADGRHAVSGSHDRTIRLWDLQTGQEVWRFDGHRKQVTDVAVSPDGRVLLSGGQDQSVRLWDLANGQALGPLAENLWNPGTLVSVAFSPDGRFALSGGGDPLLRLWDLGTRQLLREFTPGSVKNVAKGVAFSPDGRRALTGGDCVMMLWDLTTGAARPQVDRAVGKFVCVAVSPDGRRALSGDMNGAVLLWDLTTATEGILWDAAPLHSFRGHTSAVERVAFSPDGGRGLSGSCDKTIRLWQLPRP